MRQQLSSLRQCQSLDEVYRLADGGEHSRVIDLLLPLFDVNKLFDMSAASDRYARSLLLIESFFSLKNFEVIFPLPSRLSFMIRILCCQSEARIQPYPLFVFVQIFASSFVYATAEGTLFWEPWTRCSVTFDM